MLLKDLNSLLPEMKALQDRAKQFSDSSSPELRALVDTVRDMEARWEAAHADAAERESQLEASTRHAQNFQAQLDKMQLWLQLSEDKLEALTPETTDQVGGCTHEIMAECILEFHVNS